jgi:hypothetical protein
MLFTGDSLVWLRFDNEREEHSSIHAGSDDTHDMSMAAQKKKARP